MAMISEPLPMVIVLRNCVCNYIRTVYIVAELLWLGSLSHYLVLVCYVTVYVTTYVLNIIAVLLYVARIFEPLPRVSVLRNCVCNYIRTVYIVAELLWLGF